MSTLQEQLDRLIKRKGEQDPLVQMLRNQIAAQKSGQGLQELYLTGSVKIPEQIMAEQELNRDKSSEEGLVEVDYVVELLQKSNLPLTRENYLGLAYPEGVPDDLDETSLPAQIRNC